MNPNEIAKKMIFDLLIKKAMAKVIISIPLLGFPVVNPVFIYIAEKLYSVLYDELKEEGELLMIGLKTEYQEKKYTEAVEKFDEVIKKGSTDEELQKARDEFKDRLHKLITIKL
jgi:hypothetical protein